MFKLALFACVIALATAGKPVISLDMDESMVLSKAAVTRPHPESFAGAKSEKKYNMMCGANSGDKCKLPTAKAFDHHEGTLTSSIRRVCKLINSVDIPKSRWGVVACNKIDRKKRSTYEITYDVRDTSGNDADQAYVHLILFDYKAPKITQCITEGSFLEATTKGFFCGGTTAKDNVDMYKPKSTLRYTIFKGTKCKCNKCTLSQAMAKTNKAITFNTGKYSVYTYAHDFAGAYGKAAKDNKSEIKTKFTVRDTTPPKITIKGSTPVKHECATSYTDEGATASDALDNALFKRTGNKKYLIKVYNDHRTSVDHKTVTYKSRDSSFNRGGCHERSITTPFTYFNSGSATGCEHRHHYLYEYRGSDCIWTSSPTALKELGKYTYEWMRVEFKVADYGKMEYSDYVYVEMAPCLDGKCERWYGTELIRGDTKGNLGRRSIHDPYHGWYWQTLKQAKGGRSGNWMYQLDKHHNQVRIRITLKSNSDYSERHILDNLEIKGWGCDAGFSDPGAVLHDHYWSKPWNTKKATATENTVDVTKIGTYIVRYNGKDVANHKAVEQTRNVFVRDTLAPKIALKGAAVEHHWSQDKWTDRGVSTSDQCDKNLPSVKTWWGGVSNRFDQKALGTHVRYYKVCDHVNRCSQVTRKIVIADNKVPMLNLVGGSAVKSVAKRGAKYVDAGAKCSDFVDGALHHAITSSITFKGKKVTSVDRATVGKYTITYKCKDLSGNNAANVVRVVTVVDKQCPKMTLKGKGLISLEAGVSTYTEPGFTATDDIDGNLVTDVKTAITFNGKKLATGKGVDTGKVGTYVKTFTVKDKSGNAQCKSVSRKIIVKDTLPPVIQLKILKGKQLSASGQDGLDSTKNAAHKMF